MNKSWLLYSCKKDIERSEAGLPCVCGWPLKKGRQRGLFFRPFRRQRRRVNCVTLSLCKQLESLRALVSKEYRDQTHCWRTY